jgi:hypothetical protein
MVELLGGWLHELGMMWISDVKNGTNRQRYKRRMRGVYVGEGGGGRDEKKTRERRSACVWGRKNVHVYGREICDEEVGWVEGTRTLGRSWGWGWEGSHVSLCFFCHGEWIFMWLARNSCAILWEELYNPSGNAQELTQDVDDDATAVASLPGRRR